MSIDTPYSRKPQNSRVFAGLLLLGTGGILLLRQFDIFFFPSWLFSWPTFLIVLGLFTGARHNFRKPGWLVLVLIGSAFLFDRIFDVYALRHVIWPVIIIALGIWMIFRRNIPQNNISWDARMNSPQPDVFSSVKPADEPAAEYAAGDFAKATDAGIPPRGEDFIDSTSVFGGVKRIILSKNFRGGNIVNIFGGIEIDLSQADINGRVIIDITQLFGGIKLVVPPHWQVTSDLAAVFSNVDDKRRMMGTMQQSADKVLVLKGTSILAGIDIRSY